MLPRYYFFATEDTNILMLFPRVLDGLNMRTEETLMKTLTMQLNKHSTVSNTLKDLGGIRTILYYLLQYTLDTCCAEHWVSTPRCE